MADRFDELSEFKYENKTGNRMIKQLLNPVIAKYRDLSMSRISIICLSLRLRQIIDLLATDKSRYFSQPRPIIVKYLAVIFLLRAGKKNGKSQVMSLRMCTSCFAEANNI